MKETFLPEARSKSEAQKYVIFRSFEPSHIALKFIVSLHDRISTPSLLSFSGANAPIGVHSSREPPLLRLCVALVGMTLLTRQMRNDE